MLVHLHCNGCLKRQLGLQQSLNLTPLNLSTPPPHPPSFLGGGQLDTGEIGQGVAGQVFKRCQKASMLQIAGMLFESLMWKKLNRLQGYACNPLTVSTA